MQGTLYAFFHLCLVSVLFSGPSILKVKFADIFEIDSTSHLRILYRTVDECVYRSADERVYHSLRDCVRTSAICTHSQLPATSKQTQCQDDCYSQALTFENRKYHALILTSEYATPTSFICAIAFAARLNSLQVHQVIRENNKRTSTYTHLVPSKLVAACNAGVLIVQCIYILQVQPTYTCHAHNYCEKPRKCPDENSKHLGNSFEVVHEAGESQLACSSKQVGMTSINRAVVWYV